MSKQFAAEGDLVLSALRGLVRSNRSLHLIDKDKAVFVKTHNTDKVTLLSGGGAGHEPTHAGFVGPGGLDCAVSGRVFASPSTKAIYSGLKAVESPLGTLIIVKNYTGDVLHFGLAAERARAAGMNVQVVIVGDDVAVGRAQGGLVGRRGLAAVALVHKIAGAAAAARKWDLAGVATIAQSVVDSCVTVGASLDHCNVPNRPFETNLSNNEMEIGMGIHNEPGVKRRSPIPTISDLVSELLSLLVSPTDSDRNFVDVAKSHDLVLLVNNLGGLSNLEISHIADVAASALKDYNIVRVICGTFTTSMNMSGFSLTLLNATKARESGPADVLELLDAPISVSGWPSSGVGHAQVPFAPSYEGSHKSTEKSAVLADKAAFRRVVEKGIHHVIAAEPQITKYDTAVGDGDCGETLVAGGQGILAAFDANKIEADDAVNGIADIADLVEDHMGGTSGGLYSILLSALAKGLRETASRDNKGGNTKVSVPLFAKAATIALATLYKYTGARPQNRTLIDALAPFVDTLHETNDLKKAVDAAQKGADSTRKQKAKFGRASYVGDEEYARFEKEGGIPDPGAVGLAALLRGFLEGSQVT